MACISVALEFPTLPSPLSLTPPSPPPINVSLQLCCKKPILAASTPPVPFAAAILNPTVIAIINAQLALAEAYIDNLPIKCPRE